MNQNGIGFGANWLTRTVALAITLPAVITVCVASADTLELSTGETLIGKVVEKSADKVLLEHALLGTLEFPASSVAAITLDGKTEPIPQEIPSPSAPPPVGADAADPLVTPKPAKSDSIKSESVVAEAEPASEKKDSPPAPKETPSPSAKPEAKPVATPAATPVEMSEPVAVPLGGFFNTGLLSDWKTKWSLGMSGFSGVKDRIDFYTKIAGKLEDKTSLWQFKAEAFYSDSPGTPGGPTKDEGKFETTKRWKNVADHWFVFATGQYRYNRLKDWEERVAAYGGVGRTLIKGEVLTLSAEVGIGGDYQFGSVDDFTPEAVFGASALAWKINPRELIEISSTIYPNLEYFGDLRFENELEWRLKIDAQTDTVLKFGLHHEFESNKELDDVSDLKYFAAIEFSF